MSEERSKYINKYRKYHTQTSRQSAWLKHRAEASIMRAIDEVYTSNPWCQIPAKSPGNSKRRSKRSKCPAHRGNREFTIYDAAGSTSRSKFQSRMSAKQFDYCKKYFTLFEITLQTATFGWSDAMFAVISTLSNTSWVVLSFHVNWKT